MASLQKKFHYEGDTDTAPFKQIYIDYQLPLFEFAFIKNMRSSHSIKTCVRNTLGTYDVQFSQKLSKTEYGFNILNNGFIGKTDESVMTFWQYLIDSIFNFKNSDLIEPKDISLLSFDAFAQFQDDKGDNFGKTNIDGIFSLALSSDKFGQLIKDPLNRSSNEEIKKLSLQKIAYTKDNLILINKEVFIVLVSKVRELDGNIKDDNVEAITLGIISLLTKITASTPKLIYSSILNARTTQFLGSFGLKPSEITPLVELIALFTNELFEFPISIPEIGITQVAGTFKIETTDTIKLNDFKFYNLALDFSVETLNGFQSKNLYFDWNTKTNDDIASNTIKFSFEPLLSNLIKSEISVSVKGFDGTVLFHETFPADNEELGKLEIEVESLRPAQPVESNPKPVIGHGTRLTGKVLELTGNCVLKDLTVIIEAKINANSPLKIVATATTDASGNFSMPYPLGIFVAAQAIVSLTPTSPVEILVFDDNEHKATNHTISEDFLFLLVNADCTPKKDKDTEDDCDCHAQKKASRLPSQEQLIASDEFMQDIGGACINLTTPNRTLREYPYKAIVRTSDPDVANFTLEKIIINKGTTDEKTIFNLKGGQTKIFRSPVDLGNPIRWQDAPDNNENLSLYQAVTVATGHLLHYKAAVKADGYSLGELLYSLPLAPGQKKQIVIFDQTHTLEGAEIQRTSQRESLAASIVNERSILDTLTGNIQESIEGKSTAKTGGISAGLGLAGTIGGISGVLGISGGTAKSSSTASQESSRTVAQSFEEKLRGSITQSADSYRELTASVVTTVQEGQQYGVTAEVIANHNHCHSLTMMYFEVLRHYAVYQELSAVEECLFVPLLMTNFSTENIYKWRDILSINLLPLPSQTYLQPLQKIGIALQHPLIKAFDASERIKTDYGNVDFPVGIYANESIEDLSGYIRIRIHIPRPKTRFDRILSLPVIKQTVTSEGGVDVGATIRGNIKDTIVGSIVPCAAKGPTIKRSTNTTEVLTRAEIFDMFMTLDGNYETVPPSRCIRVNFDVNDVFYNPIGILFDGDQTPTPIDFFAGMSKEKNLWEAYAKILDIDLRELFSYFNNNLIGDWDRIFNEHIAPQIVERLVNESTLVISPFSMDISPQGKYIGGHRVMQFNLLGAPTSLKRSDIDKIQINFSSPITGVQKKTFFDFVTFDLESIYIMYNTDYSNGTIIRRTIQNDLRDGVPPINTPLNSYEKRSPRKEDKLLVEKLIEHLNSNLEYYNIKLWEGLDYNRRFLLLDGFHIQTNDIFGQPEAFRSLASVVKNELIAVVGNSLVLPVAPGYRVDRLLVAEQPVLIEGRSDEAKAVDLFEHYKPLTPSPPYRISVSTKGVYAEAVQGACNACEKVMNNTSQDWDKFKSDEPTAINSVTVPVPTVTDWRAAFKDFATPIVNIQNAPSLPAPGAGLAGLNDLLGKSDVFKDVTGLTENQKNAMQTYLSNQENAKAFAQMAKEMNMQAHNTGNSDKIQDTINEAESSGKISKEDAGKLTKEHIQQMIDGGESKKAEQEHAKQSIPTLTGAAIKAADQGKNVKATKTDTEGNIESVDINGIRSNTDLASVKGNLSKIKQDNGNACWATAATIMMRWKTGNTKLSIKDVLTDAGDLYLQKFNKEEVLKSSEKEGFISAINMIGEAPASYPLQQYIDWIKTYGPLWITTDSQEAEGYFSPHARILFKIVGTGTPDGIGTDFIFIDPATGTEQTESFDDFLKKYEQMVTDNPGSLFVQIVHFKDEISKEIVEGAGLTTKIKIRNGKFNNEAVKNCNVVVRNNFISGSTNNQGDLNVDFTSLSDGNYILDLGPSNIFKPGVTFTGLGDPSTNPADRIWVSPGGIQITILNKKITAVSSNATLSGKAIEIKLNPAWMNCPNHAERDESAEMIVIHHTGSGRSPSAIGGSLNHFFNPDSTSAHYIIDRDGTVIKLVHESKAAKHAGCAHWGGSDSINSKSIGIEIVHSNFDSTGEIENYSEDFTEEQYDSLSSLLQDITTAGIGILPHKIVGHNDVATTKNSDGTCNRTALCRLGRKSSDPGRKFDWQRLNSNGFGIYPSGGMIHPESEYGGLFNQFPTIIIQSGDRDIDKRYGGRVRAEINVDIISEIQADLITIGYFCSVTGIFDIRTSFAVHMFNEHFFSGSAFIVSKRNDRVDLETANAIKGVLIMLGSI